MKRQPPSLLAFSALMLCTLHQTEPAWSGTSRGSRSAPASSSSSPSTTSSSTASPSEVMGGRDDVEPLEQRETNISTNYGNQSQKSGTPSSRLEAGTAQVDTFSFNTSRENISTVMSDWAPSRSSEEEASSHCAYRVFEGGIGGQLCFRNTLLGYKCEKTDCRTVVSLGNLVANILINGSVLLQWSQEGDSTMTDQGEKASEKAADSRRGGYELSCWWNGSYTQFECAGVHLGSSCSDFLLTELHENIPYRLCLRSLSRSNPAQSGDQRDCIEFTLPPSGMQDIVIAMTTVGGAICVMLVIICLLVAYITENIMTPTAQHTYSYRTHSCH